MLSPARNDASSPMAKRSWSAYRNIIIWYAILLGPILYIGYLGTKAVMLWGAESSPDGAPDLSELYVRIAIIPLACTWATARLFMRALREAVIRMPGAERETMRDKVVASLSILGASMLAVTLLSLIPAKHKYSSPYR